MGRIPAGRFARLGLPPLDSRSYLQTVALTRLSAARDSFVRAGDMELREGHDFAVVTSGLVSADIVGPLVAAADAGSAPPDDGRDAARGAVVLIDRLNAAALSETREQWSRRGAVALVATGDGPAGRIPTEIVRAFTRPRPIARDGVPPARELPLLILSDAGAARMAAATTARVETRVVVRVESAPVTAHNVAALVRGVDPALHDKAVVFTAHYDAFGRRRRTLLSGRRRQRAGDCDDDGLGQRWRAARARSGR